MNAHRTKQRNDRRIAIVGGRGASVVSVTRDGVGGYRTEVLGASRTTGPGWRAVEDALTAAVEAVPPGRGKAVLALAELCTQTKLVAVPAAKGADLHALLAHELDHDDAFVSLPVGEAMESGRALAGHLVFSARRAGIRACVGVIEGSGQAIDAPVTFDRAFLAFAACYAGDTVGVMKVVALVQPCWVDLACIADGRPLFARRVETAANIPPRERIGAALTEAQKTALVVRGRLKSPAPFSGCVLIDPLSLGSEEDAKTAAEAADLEIVVAPFRVTVHGTDDLAVSGDALRAAVIDAADAIGGLESSSFDVPTRGMTTSRRRRIAAAALAVMSFWGAGYGAREAMMVQSRKIRTAGVVETPTPAANPDPESLARSEALTAAVAFAGDHAAVLRFGVRTAPISGLLERIAAAAPTGAAIEEITITRDPSETGAIYHDAAVRGFVRDGFAAGRKEIRAFAAGLRNSSGIVSVEEIEDPRSDPRALPEVQTARRLTPFSFVLASEDAP